jgi:hypothetical protein
MRPQIGLQRCLEVIAATRAHLRRLRARGLETRSEVMDDRIAGNDGVIDFVWFEMLGAVHTKIVLYSAQASAFGL